MFKITFNQSRGQFNKQLYRTSAPSQNADNGIELETNAIDYLRREVDRMRRNGAEVVFPGSNRAFVINKSTTTEVLDVVGVARDPHRTTPKENAPPRKSSPHIHRQAKRK